MIDEITSLFTQDNQSVTTDIKKTNQDLTQNQDIQEVVKLLERVDKNLTYQNHILYVDTIVLSAVLFFTLLYRFFKIFI